jgi:hypothetical protein
MSTENFSSYGLREIRLAPLTQDNSTGASYGALVRAYGAQEASINVVVSENELRGDDGVLEVDSTVSSCEWSFSNALISFETMKVLFGGTISDIVDETSAVIGKKYTISGAQTIPYFGLVALTEKEGSLKAILHKAKCTGGLEFAFADEEYCVVSASGKAVFRQFDGKIFETRKYEATNPIAATDLE